MNSVIVWVLLIQMNGGYCMESVSITFSAEAYCEAAKLGLDKQHRNSATCSPMKKDK
jgi:hypothetical protein